MSQIPDLADACRRAILDFYAAAETATDPAELAGAFLAIEDIKGDVQAARNLVEQRLVEAMGDDPELTVEGAVLEVRRADSRKAWAHQDLAAEVADRLVQSSVDFETGEILKSPEELLREMVTYAGVSYWKVGALKQLGISADDYCEITEGGMKIRLHRS
jgi:hypothetical protein